MTPGAAEGDATVAIITDVLLTGLRPPGLEAGNEELAKLVDRLVAIASFTQSLAQGDLDREMGEPGVVPGSLKELQAALRHVTWQAQRVAAGDLSQRVDFMGDFAEAFNHMVEALAEARDASEAQNARLEQLATTDGLTGIWNRRKFNELATAEVARAQRYGQPLSLALIDVDRFKRINDTYGHDVGDAVLRELAEVLRGQIREVDSLARWGGEEFVLLSPAVPAEDCRELAERLRLSVAAHLFPAVGHVTVSIGVTGLQGGDLAGALFARADRALYAAKEGGRDRVELA